MSLLPEYFDSYDISGFSKPEILLETHIAGLTSFACKTIFFGGMSALDKYNNCLTNDVSKTSAMRFRKKKQEEANQRETSMSMHCVSSRLDSSCF